MLDDVSKGTLGVTWAANLVLVLALLPVHAATSRIVTSPFVSKIGDYGYREYRLFSSLVPSSSPRFVSHKGSPQQPGIEATGARLWT